MHGNRGPRQGAQGTPSIKPNQHVFDSSTLNWASASAESLILSRGLAVRKREGGILGFRGRTGTRGHAGLSVSW